MIQQPQVQAPVLFLFFLLLLLGTCECHAFRGNSCMFDSLVLERQDNHVAVSIVYDLPKPGEKRLVATKYLLFDRDWSPIRIEVSAEDLKNESMYCNAAGETRPNFRGELVECKEADVITAAKRGILLKTIIPEAIKLHADRLLVKPLPGPVVVSVPRSGVCTHFTVPEAHKTDGVDLTDFILYVAAGPGATFTAICSEESIENRPVTAVMNFEPARIFRTRYAVRIAAHEIAHALGFSYLRMKSLDMVETVGFSNEMVKAQVKSKMTTNVSQWHYNCNSIMGAYLEEEEAGEKTLEMLSHWERRFAKDELMGMYFDIPGAMLYTAFTMAAFEDMKYFRANWGKEETMSWGKNAGCQIQDECIISSKSRFPSMFCDSTSETLRCTSDRFALGTCSLVTYESGLLPPDYRYFLGDTVSGSVDTLTDRCPIIAPTAETVCINGVEESMPGSRVGETSRCLNGNDIVVKTGGGTGRVVGDVCANVKCMGGQVYVQYKGDEAWHLCRAGESLELGGASAFSSGRIACPPQEEVCTGLSGAVLTEEIHLDENGEGDEVSIAPSTDVIAPGADAGPATVDIGGNTPSDGNSGRNENMDRSPGTSNADGRQSRDRGHSSISGGNRQIDNANTNSGVGREKKENRINNNNAIANIDVTMVKSLLWASLACVAVMASVLLIP